MMMMMMMSSNYRRLTTNLAMGMFHNHRYSPSNINPYSTAPRNPTTRLFQYTNKSNNKTSSSSNTSIAAAAAVGNKVNPTTTISSSSSSSSAFFATISALKYKCSWNGNFNRAAGSKKKGWFGKLVKLLFITDGVCLGFSYYWHIETVPYTKRTRLIPMPIFIDKIIGEKLFEDHKKRCEIVPENECESIRLRLILKDIVDALHRDVASKESDGGHFGAKATTKHLDGLNWEILLVSNGIKEPTVYCFPGKIVANTSILQHFKTDDEIASLIAHEVGHIVARHTMEKFTNTGWYSIIDSISSHLIVFFTFWIPIPHVANKISSFGGKLSQHLQSPEFEADYIGRKLSQHLQSHEFEADYIGLMLMASAGYDPTIAPEVQKKVGFLTGNTKPCSYLTHPCGEERAQMLSEEMDKALNIYEKVKLGYSIQQRKEGGLLLTVKEGGGIDIDANPPKNCA